MAYISFDPRTKFNIKLYTGTGSAASITGVGFQPDWVWVKDRSASNSHQISDVLRGATKTWFTDAAAAETTDAQRLTSFDSDGFSIGTNSSWNTSSNNYVAWNWKAGGAGVTNTDGNMNTTVTVSADTTAGFSIIRWTGSGNTTYNTIGHGLGVAPKWVMVKNLTDSQAGTIGTSQLGWGNALDISSSGGSNASTTYWNDTAPSSSVITLGSSGDTNGTGDDMIAYAFAQVKGFSAFGRYVGNGDTSGPQVYCGFRPAFVLFKKESGSAADWQLWDNKRDTHNPIEKALHPQITNTASADQDIHFTANGFKIKSSANHINEGAYSFHYMAFAAAPVVGSNGIPSTGI